MSTMKYLLSLLTVMLLAACATPEGEGYPSLAIRGAERVTGQLDAPAAPSYVPPATPVEVLDRLDQLVALAADAHAEFLSEADRTQRLVSAASGAAVATDRWADAQVALAELELARSDAMVALADLDRLYAEASVEAEETVRIAAAREDVIAMVEAENTVIDSLLATLR